FSNTVQHYPFQHRKLLDDLLDFGQSEVLGRFKRLKGADTRVAFRIAAIRGFEIQGVGQSRNQCRTLRRIHARPPSRYTPRSCCRDHRGAGAPNFGQIFMWDLFPVKHDVLMPGKRTVRVWGLQVPEDRAPASTAAAAWAPVTGAGSTAGGTKFRGLG